MAPGPARLLPLLLAGLGVLLLFNSPLLGAILMGAAFAVLLAGRRSPSPHTGTAGRSGPKPSAAGAFADVKRTAQDDVLALGDDIRSLDVEIDRPGVPPEATADYERGLERYAEATAAFDAARTPEDFGTVTTATEDGRYAIASARARLEGRPPPQRRPPCFFDPRHGPSVRDVEWAPPGGAPRAVPACAADAIAVEEGRAPYTREVHVGDRRVPYWNAPAYYGGWAGGFFSPFGGLLPGLLIGSALGSTVFGLPFDGQLNDDGTGDVGDAGDGEGPDNADSGWDAGGTDAGGGSDFGGGDFGGGWDGGDFGGGDGGGF